MSESYGKCDCVEHVNDFFTAYANVSAFADGLENGNSFNRGDIIGHVGNTEESSKLHLQFELIYKGKFIGPLFESNTANSFASDDGVSGDT